MDMYGPILSTSVIIFIKNLVMFSIMRSFIKKLDKNANKIHKNIIALSKVFLRLN